MFCFAVGYTRVTKERKARRHGWESTDLFLKHGRRHDKLPEGSQIDSWPIDDGYVSAMLLVGVVEVCHTRVVREAELDVFNFPSGVNYTKLVLLYPADAFKPLLCADKDLLLAVPFPV